MVGHMLKTISSKILLWLLILSALFSVSCLLDVQRSTRIIVKTADLDCTVLAICCQFVCLVLTALLFHWQLGKVEADKPSLLNSWVTTAAFMLVTIPLVTRSCLHLGFRFLLGKHIDWVRPFILKWMLLYAGFTLYLMYRQLSVVTASRFRALKVVLFLVIMWCSSVFLVTFCFLRLGLHRMFTHSETLVDVTETSYGHLLLASFVIFLFADYNHHPRAALPNSAPVSAYS